MSESSSYSSLLDLVENHLSKINVQSSHYDAHTSEDDTIRAINKPPGGFCYGANKRLAIPPFVLAGNLVNNVLAEQVSNMLKAKQTKEEQQQKLTEELKAVHNLGDELVIDHNIIDLMDAIRTPFKTALKCASVHSSTESLFEPTFIEFDDESKSENLELPVALLCGTDLTYILGFKEPKGKCSSFGKILVSKFRPFLLPYKRRISFSTVQKFDFKSKSPCDIIKEKTMHKNL